MSKHCEDSVKRIEEMLLPHYSHYIVIIVHLAGLNLMYHFLPKSLILFVSSAEMIITV